MCTQPERRFVLLVGILAAATGIGVSVVASSPAGSCDSVRNHPTGRLISRITQSCVVMHAFILRLDLVLRHPGARAELRL
jgi:hypothetical protein